MARRDDGGIALREIEQLSDTEKHALFVHFGRPIMSMTGGNDAESFYDSPIRYEPGTPEHFKAAAHALPHPFYLMPPGY